MNAVEAQPTDRFALNNNGHIVLTIVGLDLTGMREIERLTANGFTVSELVRSCLLSGIYDMDHRLVAGRCYEIALLPTGEIEDDRCRTVAALRRRGIDRYGYGLPRAGFMPRLPEVISSSQMQKMGFEFISVTHDFILDSDRAQRVFSECWHGSVFGLHTAWGHPEALWGGRGAVAFPVS
jgi:hypothetical protein